MTKSADKEKRIKFCVAALRKGWRKSRIKEYLRENFVDEKGISARTIESYLSEAKTRLREDYGIPIDEHREDAYTFLREMRDDESIPARVRIKAQEEIMRLLGLEFREETDERDVNVTINFQDVMDAARQAIREENEKNGKRDVGESEPE